MASIVQRGDSYLITVSAGRDLSGKQIRKYLTWKPDTTMTARQKDKQIAIIALEFEKKILQGYIADDKQTFAKYATYVIDLKERNGSKHRTIVRYKELMERIISAIGHIRLFELRPQHLNELYKQLGQDGQNKKTGGRLSNKTIVEHHRLISTILAQAEKEMLVPYNVASKATPPKIERKEPNYFQVEVVEQIRKCLENEPLKWKVATNLLLVTGCRRGEICGLKWDKIDFKNNQIKIDTQLLYAADRGVYEDTTKTSSSFRTIKIPVDTIELLKHYETWYLEQKLLNGDRWVNSNFLFIQEDGKPMNPDSLTDWLNKFSLKYNLPHINPHAFRHTHASILFFSGIDGVTISKRLGHAKISTTTDIYSHIIKQADETASNCISDVMLKSKSVKDIS